MMEQETLQRIEQITGYKFSDADLLQKALTHSSAVEQRVLSNERLEFFGDAVLGVVICQILFEQFPNYLEGSLTKIKSAIVSRRICSKVAKQLGLVQFLKVGKGMMLSRSLTGSLAAGVVEAVIGAIYIDGGFDAARKFVLKAFGEFVRQADAQQSQGNFKSVLQQYAHQHFNTTPVYRLLDEKGPDHSKCFEIQAVIASRHFTSAWGVTKKEAEQKAAFNALAELGAVEGTMSD